MQPSHSKMNSHKELVTPQFTNHTSNVQEMCRLCQGEIINMAKKRRK